MKNNNAGKIIPGYAIYICDECEEHIRVSGFREGQKIPNKTFCKMCETKEYTRLLLKPGRISRKEETEICNCKWCGQETDFTGTEECNRCWELRHRIESNMDLAETMLNHFKSERI